MRRARRWLVRRLRAPAVAAAAAVVALFASTASGADDAAPSPIVSAVTFRGLAAIGERKARAVVALRPGERVSREAAAAAANRLLEAYRARHFYDPRVRWSVVATDRPGEAAVVFDVAEGPRGVVTELAFSGHRALDRDALEAVVRVKPRRGPWARFAGLDVFLREELEADRAAIARAYADLGYLEAEVSEAAIRPIGRDAVRIEWTIAREGPRFRVSAVEFAGAPVFGIGQLRSWVDLPEGVWMSPARVAAAAERIAAGCRERGYPFATATAGWRRGGEPSTAVVAFDVQPGPLCTVRAVAIEGRTVTRERVIRREIEIEPGAPYRESDAAGSHVRLLALGIFESVETRAVAADAPGQCDVRFTVKEKMTGTATAGLTYGSVEGAAAILTLAESNFAAMPPFRGGGLRLQAVAQWGPEHQDFDLSLTNPRLADSAFLLRGSLFYHNLEYLSGDYDQRTAGGAIGIGRPFARLHLVVATYGLQQMEILNVATNASETIRSEEGTQRLGSVSLQWTRDGRRPAFRPTGGGRTTADVMLGSDALGGNTDVYAASLAPSVHWTPGLDHVLNLRAFAHGIDAYGGTDTVPLSLRDFLGGPADLRGFEYRSVSPRDEAGNAVGGRTAWYATAEYTVPVASWLDASVYYDVGHVSENAFDLAAGDAVADWGIGLTIRAENFPVRFDFAVPTRTDAGTEDQLGETRLSFSAGYAF